MHLLAPTLLLVLPTQRAVRNWLICFMLFHFGCGAGSAADQAVSTATPDRITPLQTVTSTVTPPPSPITPSQPDLIQENRRRWQSFEPRVYRFVHELICFCFAEYPHLAVLRVEDGELVSLRDLWTATPISDPPAGAYFTIDGMFDLIVEAQQRNADRIHVDYDPELGFPRVIAIDYDIEVADDEISIRTTHLQILETTSNSSLN